MQPRNRKLILEAALDLLVDAGLSGVTLGRIARNVGMSKSGLFAHFRSIEELHLALVFHVNQLFRAEMMSVAQHGTALDRLLHTVGHWFGGGSDRSAVRQAPLLSAEFDVSQGGVKVQQAVAENEDSWRHHLKALIHAAVEEGALNRLLDVEALADELCGIYYNYMVCYRCLRRPRAREAASLAIQRALQRELVDPDHLLHDL